MNRFHKLITNLVFVDVDRERARQHWREMAELSGLSPELYWANRKVIVEQKAVAGILSHRQTRGFILHRMKERSILRRIERQRKPPKSYAEKVSDMIDRVGWAHDCRNGHSDCSLSEQGSCSDELSQHDREYEAQYAHACGYID